MTRARTSTFQSMTRSGRAFRALHIARKRHDQRTLAPPGPAAFVVQRTYMAKKMLIDATHAEETRVVVVDGNKVEEFDFGSENKRQLAGNIYLAKVTRVEPSLQAAFVDYGGNRHGFLAFSEIHPDYYQIPVADREALLEEERAYAEAMKARDEEDEKPKPKRSCRRRSSKAAEADNGDSVAKSDIDGMETIDLDDEAANDDEGLSPMETVAETPVEEPQTTTPPRPVHRRQKTPKPVPMPMMRLKTSPEDDEDEPKSKRSDASSKDESIESVADDDDQEDIRPPRKPRPRRYKIQKSSRSARSCWCRSSRKSAATRAQPSPRISASPVVTAS